MNIVPFKKAPKQEWEKAFDDWKRLLDTAKANELLDDPTAVWDEAWRNVAMISIATAKEFNNEELVAKLRKRLLE